MAASSSFLLTSSLCHSGDLVTLWAKASLCKGGRALQQGGACGHGLCQVGGGGGGRQGAGASDSLPHCPALRYKLHPRVGVFPYFPGDRFLSGKGNTKGQ